VLPQAHLLCNKIADKELLIETPHLHNARSVGKLNVQCSNSAMFKIRTAATGPSAP
jgi:hypothetical protein